MVPHEMFIQDPKLTLEELQTITAHSISNPQLSLPPQIGAEDSASNPAPNYHG